MVQFESLLGNCLRGEQRPQALAAGGFKVRAGGTDPTSLTCRYLVTAPGLSSQEVAGRIEGYPAVVVLASDGRQVGRLGYQEGGPGPFVDALKGL